jgi:FkbM family methyltransferase
MSPIDSLKIVKRRYAFWKERTFTGEYELKILHQYVDKAKFALDVGGNIGSYTYQLSRLAAGVVTFEPNPYYLARLRALRLRNVRFEEVALSDRTGVASLRIPQTAGGDEDQGMASIEEAAIPAEAVAREIDVKTKRLDDCDFDPVGFFKIDVEGHEEAVLRGARLTLARHRPVVLVEIEERRHPGAVARINAQMHDLGFAGYFYKGSQRHRIETFEPARDQPETLVWDKRRHTRRTFPFVNNFLFVPNP